MSNKTKVLIVISNLEFGGAQRQIVELVNNIDNDKFDIHVCSLSEYVPLSEQFIPATKLHIINKKAKFDFSVVFKLAKLIRKHKFDVIHSYLFDAEIAARLAGKLSATGIKILGSERNANYTLKPIQKRAYKLTGHMVSGIIANSQSGADYNALQTGLAPSKYHVVYNGVDTKRFQPQSKQAARAALNITENTPLIGMFASFKQQKNHPFLIAALTKLKHSHPYFKVLFVGDMLHGGLHGSDDYCADIKQQIEVAGLAEQVIYLGNCDNVEAIYPACDFTVLPSLFEGTPNVVLESMACGIPVIATRVSDNDKIIEHGASGHIVELNDVPVLASSIKQFLDDSEYLAAIAIKARQAMEDKFSSYKLAENMGVIYANSIK